MAQTTNDNKPFIDASTMIAGAVAGSLARIPTHPLDTLKARLQSGSFPGNGHIFRGLIDIYSIEGIRGLYRGFFFTATWSAPASCLYFTTYETARRHVFVRDSPLSHLASGFLAETISCLLWVPIDVIKERMQTQRVESTRYRSGINAVLSISKSKEGLMGLYKGYFATLASFGPFSAIYFMLYEEVRSLVSATRPQDKPLSPIVYATLGAGSGAVAAFITNPLDMVKLRRQIIEDKPTESFVAALVRVWQNEGVRGLFRGSVARAAFSGSATAVNMMIFESTRWMIAGKDRRAME